MIQAIKAMLGLETPGGPMPLMARSPKWPAARAAHLRREPECQACGTRERLEVHHVAPVHLDPKRELDPTNMLTACERCHLFVCHLGRWASWNTEVRADAAAWRAKIKGRP